METRLATITTGITQLTDDGPVYRGRGPPTWPPHGRSRMWPTGSGTPRANVTAGGSPGDADGEPSRAGAPAWAPVALGPLPEIGSSDRMRWAVVMAGALDPLRADLRPEAVTRTARQVAASMVEVLAPPAGGGNGGGPVRTPSEVDRCRRRGADLAGARRRPAMDRLDRRAAHRGAWRRHPPASWSGRSTRPWS